MNILILSTEEYLTLRLLKCLAPSGAVVHVMGVGPGRAVCASRHCRSYRPVELPPLNSPAGPLCAEIDRFCRRNAIDVILPSGMASGFFLAASQASLSTAALPMPPVELLQMLNNKWLFSRLLAQHELPFPHSCLLERAEDAAALDIAFPIIIKPLDLDAGRGVTRCDTPEEIAARLRRGGFPLIVQEYIPGEDVGLGLLARAGEILAWTIQRQCSDGSGVEFIRHDAILNLGRRLMDLCNYDGIAHFDLRLDSRDGSIKVLECNPRFWASLPFCMLAGVNFPDLGLRLALDKPLPEICYQTVNITFPTKVLSRAARGLARSLPLSESSRLALRFTLSDPLPNLLLGAGRLQDKISGLFLRGRREVYGR